MKKSSLKRALLGGVLVAAIAAPAFAATQGNISGTASTGTVTVTARIPKLVRISNLTDMSLPDWDGTSNPSAFIDFCVWSTSRAYKVTASGSGAGGVFSLAGQTTSANTVAYTVAWRDQASTTTALTAGTQLSGQSATVTSPTCNSGAANNTRVTVTIAASVLEAVPNDTYVGVLTLTVAPE
jgi:hypothetical protein